MSKMKYYAVAIGDKTNIYTSWDECKVHTHGVKGAVFKSFSTLEDANAFLELVTSKNEQFSEDATSSEQHLIAFVDGSYLDSIKKYAYGCVMVLPDDVITFNGAENDPDYIGMRNVAGEIRGSEEAVNWAIEHGYNEITIYYDYEGIEKWANDIWQANKAGTIRYKDFISEKRLLIKINFQKVDAHTGVKYNELADKTAKLALGIK